MHIFSIHANLDPPDRAVKWMTSYPAPFVEDAGIARIPFLVT